MSRLTRTKCYPHVTGVYGDQGENPGALAVHAVVHPDANYPEEGRIIVGSPTITPSISGYIPNLGGFSCGPAAAEALATTLTSAAAEVRAAMGQTAKARTTVGQASGAEASAPPMTLTSAAAEVRAAMGQPTGDSDDDPATSTTDGAPPRFAPRTVTCAWCKNRYRSAIPRELDQGLQGSHCASDVIQEGDEWIVRGSYGSDDHDLHRYKFVANKPTTPADPVCDECISERQLAGDLEDIGLHCDRRPGDFGPRPRETWGLVGQIQDLVKRAVVLRRLAEVACREHDGAHQAAENGSCPLCAEIRAYRKYQRWTGELEDGGEEYAQGCPEMAEQLREGARALEGLAAFWERKRRDP